MCSKAEVEWHVNEDEATRAVQSALPLMNEALETLRRLFLLESLSDALKVLPVIFFTADKYSESRFIL